MKKALSVLALLLAVGFLAVAAADNKEGTPVEPSAVVAQPATADVAVACGAVSDDAGPGQSVEPAIANEFIARAMAGGHPTCPEERTCSGGNSECGGQNACGLNESTVTITDTGWSGCDDLVCPLGRTVHIKEGYCQRCSCCTAYPACVCPNTNAGCGKVVEVFCK